MYAKLIAFLFLFIAGAASATLPIQHWQTPAGARVFFVENHDLPMIDLSVNFGAGSGYDSAEKSGLASLVRHMLPLGAEGLSEDDIAKKLADIGATMGGSFDPDRAGLSLRTLVSEKKAAVDIFAQVLQHPLFDQGILEREKTRIISNIREAQTQPEYLLGRSFSKMLYGDHPYGLEPGGSVETVAKIDRQDLLDFYSAHYLADRAVIAIVGDISRQDAEDLAIKLGSGLKTGVGPAPIKAPVLPAKAETKTIDNPSSQSHIAVGYLGVKRIDPDYFPLYVGNYILGGGGFVSRLLNEVREKRGLAYSTSSYFYPLEQQGPFRIELQTRRDQTAQALAIVKKVLADFVDQGPTADELKAAKQNIVGGFALRIDSNAKIHEYLGVIGYYGLPLTYLDDFTANVEKVTVAQIRDAFKRRIDPSKMVTVVVGAAGG